MAEATGQDLKDVSNKVAQANEKGSAAIAVPMTGMQESLSKMASVLEGISIKMDALSNPAFVESWFPRFLNGLHLIHNDLIEAFNLDKEKMRLAAEQMAEAGRVGEAAEGAKVEDKSFDFDFGFGTVAVAILGLLVGFFQGFFGPVGTLMKSWGTAIKNFFGKPLKWGWTTFKAMLADSKVAVWYRSVKNWFAHAKFNAKFKWAMFKDMLKNSKLVGYFKAVKAWFGGTIKFGWTSLANLLKKLTFYDKIKDWFTAKGFVMPKWTAVKALFAESSIGILIGKIKAWFKLPTGAKLPSIKALWAESTIGKGIANIKKLFSGKIKIPGIGEVDNLLGKVKGLFGPTGPFRFFAAIGRALGKIFFFVQIFMAMFDFYSGFVETEGNLLDKILGGLKAALMGFFGGFLDLGIMLEDAIKWIVTKIAGFFGFDEKEIGASMESFSIFKPLKQMLEDVIDWFIALFDFSSFSAGLISAAKLIFLPVTALLDLVGFVWDWFMELFGWKDENAPKDDRTLTTKLGDMLIGVWDWFLGLFSFGTGDGAGIKMGPYAGVGDALINMVTGIWDWFKGLFDFSSFGATLITAAKLLFLPYVALMDLVGGVWDWFMGLFGWDKAKITDDGQTVSGKLTDLLKGVWDWFLGLFGAPGSGHSAEMPADDGQSVGGLLLELVNGVWDWFKKLFKFGSITDVMKSYFNLLTFFPNIIKDAIAGVTSWLLGLFGFDDAAKKVANAQNYSLADMVFNVIEDIWLWLKDLLGIDVMAIAKMIPGASTLLGWMGIGDEEETKKKTELDKSTKPMTKSIAEQEAAAMPDILGGIDWNQFNFGTWFMGKLDLNLGEKIKGMMGSIMGMKEGGIVGMSSFAPGTIGDAFGLESGGLFTLTKGEFVLDNQAAGMFLQAAQLLTGSNQGQELIEGQRVGNALATATISPTIVNSSSVVNAPSTSSMMLPTADPNPYNMEFSPESRLTPA